MRIPNRCSNLSCLCDLWRSSESPIRSDHGQPALRDGRSLMEREQYLSFLAPLSLSVNFGLKLQNHRNLLSTLDAFRLATG